MSPAKALRRALSRTADVLWELPLVTQGVSQELLDQEGCLDVLSPGDLLVLLDGPNGAIGLVSVDRSMMTGMIEIQTISMITAMPVEDRPLTPTDAAMMAPLIDGALTRFEDNLIGHPLLGELQGYRFGAMVEDARTAGLLLEAPSYRVFRVAIELAGGKRQGELQIILPEHAPCEREAPENVPSGPGKHEDRLMLVPAQIEAVLCRLRLPLSRIGALKVGDVLPLPADVLAKAELMAGGGHRMARGRLGQMNGLRAIRLTWPEGARPVHMAANKDTPSGELARPEPVDPAPAVAPMVFDLDAEAGDLPDLPPMTFGDGEDDFGVSDFDFDPDASDSGDGDGDGDFPMAEMSDFQAS